MKSDSVSPVASSELSLIGSPSASIQPIASSGGNEPALLWQERRRYPRTECLTSALVTVQTWKGRRSVEGTIHSASQKGVYLELENHYLLNVGDSVSMRWKAPPAVTGFPALQECTISGTVARGRTSA